MVCDLVQPVRLRTEGLERGMGGLGQAAGLPARAVQSDQGRIGGFLRGDVLAGAFAEHFAGLRDIENIVDDLKGETEAAAERGEGFELARGGIGGHGPKPQADRDHGGGFAFVDELEFAAGGFPALGFQVGHLAGNQATAACCDGEFAEKIPRLVARGFPGSRQNLKRLRQKRIPGEHGDALAENLVRGRASASEIVIVHARQIIMDEGVRVDALDGTGRRKGLGGFSAAGLGRSEAKNRPHPLAPGQQAVTHGAVDGGWFDRGFRQQPVQRGVHLAGTLAQVRRQAHRRCILHGKKMLGSIACMAGTERHHPPAMQKLRLGILGSGKGSNFRAILEAIRAGDLDAEAVVVVSDVEDAGILQLAAEAGVPSATVIDHRYKTRLSPENEAALVTILQNARADLVVLAGYMRMVKAPLLEAFPRRIINIHPSLLPKFPGLAAWKQALEAGETRTGCTVHYVDAGMDTGEIIAQAEVPILPGDTAESVHARIQVEEHKIYPKVVASFCAGGPRSLLPTSDSPLPT